MHFTPAEKQMHQCLCAIIIIIRCILQPCPSTDGFIDCACICFYFFPCSIVWGLILHTAFFQSSVPFHCVSNDHPPLLCYSLCLPCIQLCCDSLFSFPLFPSEDDITNKLSLIQFISSCVTDCRITLSLLQKNPLVFLFLNGHCCFDENNNSLQHLAFLRLSL